MSSSAQRLNPFVPMPNSRATDFLVHMHVQPWEAGLPLLATRAVRILTPRNMPTFWPVTLTPRTGPVCGKEPSGPAELPQASLTNPEVVSDFMEQRDAHPKG